MLNEVVVEIGLGVEHEAILMQLELVEEEHEDDADEKRNEGGVERHT